MNLMTRFLKDESGATAIEYGLIAALISIVIIGGATAAGGQISAIFNRIGSTLVTANTPAPAPTP